MKRRSFLKSLAAALMVPPMLAREVIEPTMPKSLPPPKMRFVIYEGIGISIGNTAGIQRVSFM